jgi:Ser/Thr protein kinase RdoA (MazF antagonist)
MNESRLLEIAGRFRTEGTPLAAAPLGAGHINDSYRVTTAGDDAPDYVLQRINHAIFKDVDALQGNISRVTEHIRAKLAAQGVPDLDRRVLTLAPATDGKRYFRDGEGNFWRMMRYISDSVSYDEVTPDLARRAGKAFGDFQAMLADLPAPPLAETIPNFHNMESRLETFRQAVKDNRAGRLQEMQQLVDEIEARADEMCIAERLHRQGLLPKRINHCDTKVNNVLFSCGGEVLCVVDLDTVMPGYVLSDFGDFMRTGANTGAEDDPNLDNVSLNQPVFEAYTQGYLSTARSFLLPVEVDNLAFGAKLLTYMQTVRFFADYLDGDRYYKIQYPDHNRVRTLAQFKLLQDMEGKFDWMRQTVAQAANQ